MRFLIISSFLIFANLSIFAQDLFKVGLEYFEKGKYSSADSIFSILLAESPKDINVLYNYGTTRLYLGDTCSFCAAMRTSCHSYLEMDACNLYMKLCGTIDTLYFDKKYLKCSKKEARYTEIIETSKYEDFKTVYVHDKKKPGVTVITNADLVNSIKTDIVACYKLFNDSSRLFLYTTTPPAFLDGKYVYDNYLKNNPYSKECKEKLNLNKVIVGIEYVVSNMGIIKDIVITAISTPNDRVLNNNDITNLYKKATIDDMETLKNYIDLIVTGMPRRIPGKYKDENVDYLITDIIDFW